MIFPIIETEEIVQVGDKFRVMLDKSYRTPDESPITKVEIQMEAAGAWYDVTGDLMRPQPNKYWGIDYQYSTEGDKVISCRITTVTTPTPVTATSSLNVKVLTAEEDNLFSTDDLIQELQEDVLTLLPAGKASFKYKHRAAQKFILDWLWNNEYWKRDKTRFEKSDIKDIKEISDWASYVALRMIYQANISQPDDLYEKKSNSFRNAEERAREKALLKIDVDGDGSVSSGEGASITSRTLVRV